MAKDPAFLFYSSDFLTGMQDLTMEERGQYITLLCIQHQKGHLTEKMIRIAVGNAAADVLAKFRQDSGGLYYNERLDIEIEKRRASAEKQRQRAVDGWEKRKKDTAVNTTAYAAAMPLENENVNEDGNENVNTDFGKSENLLNGEAIIPTVCRNWYAKFPTYTKDQQEDFHAVGKMLGFMIRQHSITDVTNTEAREKIIATMDAIAEEVAKESFWTNKPLKSIANNIQEFYNRIKNPVQNGKSKSQPNNTRADLQTAINKRFGSGQ